MIVCNVCKVEIGGAEGQQIGVVATDMNQKQTYHFLVHFCGLHQIKFEPMRKFLNERPEPTVATTMEST